VIAAIVAVPANAHVGTTATPHWHAGDGWGIAVVFALAAVAAWLDRRRR
jgi:uncharacterized protein (TIGR03382 family)